MLLSFKARDFGRIAEIKFCAKILIGSCYY